MSDTKPSPEDIAFSFSAPEGVNFWGIPAHDLSYQEFDALPPDLQREVLFGGYYKDVRKPAKGTKSDATEPPKEG